MGQHLPRFTPPTPPPACYIRLNPSGHLAYTPYGLSHFHRVTLPSGQVSIGSKLPSGYFPSGQNIDSNRYRNLPNITITVPRAIRTPHVKPTMGSVRWSATIRRSIIRRMTLPRRRWTGCILALCLGSLFTRIRSNYIGFGYAPSPHIIPGWIVWLHLIGL